VSTELEDRFEEVLVQLDRSMMINEDFRSEAVRLQLAARAGDDPYVLKLERENKELREKTRTERTEFTLNLKRSPAVEAEKKNFEEKLAQLDMLNENYRERNKQVAKVQEALRVKEKWLEQKENELKISWQEFEKRKQEWEGRVRGNAANRSERLQLAGKETLGRSDVGQRPPAIPCPPETPSSRERTIQRLQQEIKELEAALEGITDQGELSKRVIKIDQLKNRLATLRGQKALFDSNRSSRLISNMMKAMEKEVNYEEQKRKQQLEKFSKKSEKVSGENAGPEKRERKEEEGKDKTDSKLADERQVLDLRKEILAKREKEMEEREKGLQKMWMKVPGAKELIDNVNIAVASLEEQKKELDIEREKFEKEKVEMMKVRDKLMAQLTKITQPINP
jgi:hypothetical protein